MQGHAHGTMMQYLRFLNKNKIKDAAQPEWLAPHLGQFQQE
jgi:hypothetical protein